MADRARKNLSALRAENVEVIEITGEILPFDNGTIDIIISNGAINLCPEKSALFAEMYRVIRPGGRLQLADIVLEKKLPPHLASNIESWSQ